MKKLISLVLASLLLTVTLMSCQSKTNTEGEPSSTGTNTDTLQTSTDVQAQIYVPDGAPALSIAKFMAEDLEEDSIEYHVVDASTINTYVTGDNPKADLCVLPLNMASKLLGNGENYQMLGTVTHGNLYILSVDSSLTFESANQLEQLVGKTVGVIQIANVPGLTFKAILNKYNIEWQELTGDVDPSDSKVNLKGISDAATGVSPAGGCDYYIAAEPMVSAKVGATSLEVVGNLQTLYGGENGYPQAVLVVKKEFLQQNSQWVSDFENSLSSVNSWLQTTDITTIVNAISSHLPDGQTPTFSEKNLTTEVIIRCSIYFTPSSECQSETVAFLQELIAVNSEAAALVSDDFFSTEKV
jgi:hypothetical protein